jgi:hypothetical protein
MRLRAGIVDVSVAIVVVVVILLPPKSTSFGALPMTPEQRQRIDALQARLAAGGGASLAEDLAEELVAARQSDWALRVAGAASVQGNPERWIALRAVSTTHAERIEIGPAFEYATLALQACEDAGAHCPPHDHVRLRLYHEQLDAGVRSGIDPRNDPEEFRKAVQGAIRVLNVRPGRRDQAPPGGE